MDLVAVLEVSRLTEPTAEQQQSDEQAGEEWECIFSTTPVRCLNGYAPWSTVLLNTPLLPDARSTELAWRVWSLGVANDGGVSAHFLGQALTSTQRESSLVSLSGGCDLDRSPAFFNGELPLFH